MCERGGHGLKQVKGLPGGGGTGDNIAIEQGQIYPLNRAKYIYRTGANIAIEQGQIYPLNRAKYIHRTGPNISIEQGQIYL